MTLLQQLTKQVEVKAKKKAPAKKRYPKVFIMNLDNYQGYGLTAAGRTEEEAEALLRAKFEATTGGDHGPPGSDEAWETAKEWFSARAHKVVFGAAHYNESPWPC
jgi:hypothetical protein